jgi:hypothetical protein
LKEKYSDPGEKNPAHARRGKYHGSKKRYEASTAPPPQHAFISIFHRICYRIPDCGGLNMNGENTEIYELRKCVVQNGTMGLF